MSNGVSLFLILAAVIFTGCFLVGIKQGYDEYKQMSIDDKIEYWHTHETGNSLREFLGMTEQEYLNFCLPKQEIRGCSANG